MTAALSALGNDRIVDGGNQPPAFEAHSVNVEDLRTEAGNWLTGAQITTPDEAAFVDQLLDMARKATKAADDARTAEKEPHLKAGREVDAKWKPLITSATTIADVCKAVLTPWNVAEAKRKADVAALVKAEAEAEIEAFKAARAANDGSLEAAEQIEQFEATTKLAQKAVKVAEKAAQTGLGLRTTYRPEVTDFAAAARHYWGPDRDQFEALVLTLAQRDVRAGKRTIPGVTVHEEQKAV